MIFDAESVVEEQLDKGEEIFWVSQPVLTGTVRIYLPLMFLFKLISIFFLGMALWVFFSNGARALTDSGFNRELFESSMRAELKNVLLYTASSIFFFLFRYLLTASVKDENNIIYAVTSERALIMDDGKITDQWRPGDIMPPSLANIAKGRSSGDILFAEEEMRFGKTDRGERRPIQWVGFESAEDAAAGYEAILKLRKSAGGGSSRILENGDLQFKIAIPRDWSAHGFVMNQGERDNLLFSMIAAKIISKTRAIKNATIPKKWNTLVLSRQVGQDLKANEGRINIMTILVEAAFRPERPVPGKEKRLSVDEPVDVEAFAKDPTRFLTTWQKMITICRLDNITAFNKETETFHVMLNANVSKLDLKNNASNFARESDINLSGFRYKFRQVYSYTDTIIEGDPGCLHMRYTFLCFFRDKTKYYESNKTKIDKIAESLELTSPELLILQGADEQESAPAKENQRDKPKREIERQGDKERSKSKDIEKPKDKPAKKPAARKKKPPKPPPKIVKL